MLQHTFSASRNRSLHHLFIACSAAALLAASPVGARETDEPTPPLLLVEASFSFRQDDGPIRPT
jgi:hypothetical protein